MSNPPAPRLPGFLRRSLRNPYELDESASASSAGSSRKVDGSATHSVTTDILEGDIQQGSSSSNLDDFIFSGGVGATVANRSSVLDSADDNCSNASVSSDADEKMILGGQLYVSFPERNSDAHEDGNETVRRVTRHSKSLPVEAHSNIGKTAPYQDRSSPKEALSYKETLFEKIILAPVVNVRDLRKLGWNGIPAQYRADSWKILLGYLPANASRRNATLLRKRAEYADAITQHYNIDDAMRTLQEQETLRQVLVDVPRTAPDVGLFRNERVRRCLERLLYIWAMRHPASSYVQGINDLVTPLFAVFLSGIFAGVDISDGKILFERQTIKDNSGQDEGLVQDDKEHDNWLVPEEVLSEVEADCYWCLTKLLACIQDHYTSDQPGVQRMVARLEELVRRIDVNLWRYLKNMGIEFMQFAFKWMNCLLLREFNLGCVIRLWDTYLSEGDGGFEDFHVYVCAAFLCQFSAEVQTMEFDELFGFMQNMPTDDWKDKEIEVLLSQAFVLSTLFGGSDAHLFTP